MKRGLTNLAKVCYNGSMKTVNISLTAEQAKFVDQTTKNYGFANRSEFVRALLRFAAKTNPELIDQASEAPFASHPKPVLTLEQIKKIAVPILKKNDVEFAGIFGSYARGEARPDSDLDVLVRFHKQNDKSLLDVIRLQNILQDALNLKVDLAEEGDLDELVEPQAVKDLKILYG